MGHNIQAIILKGGFDEAKAYSFDLRPIHLSADLTLFHISPYYSSYWQEKLGFKGVLAIYEKIRVLFPNERVLAHIAQEISGQNAPYFAIISTDYFGGFGYQGAQVYKGEEAIDPKMDQISPVLAYLGVDKGQYLDEFDAVGLGNHRSPPRFLDKYMDLSNEEEEE